MTTVNGNKNLFTFIGSWLQSRVSNAKARAAATTTRPATTTAQKPVDVFDPGKLLDALFPKVDGRSALDALSDANKLLKGSPSSEATQQGAVVTANAADVNSKDDLKEKNARHLEAEKQLKSNASLEELMLGRLGTEQSAQYADVKSQLADDPVAQLALQALLFSGKLGSKKALSGDDTALAGLARLSTQELAEGLDRSQLLGDLVQELACPEAINQRGRGTCAATTVAIYLAASNPAEYVRLVAGLASTEGSVKLASGQQAYREVGTEAEDGTNRSLSQRLLAPAFMEIANGKFDYSNKDDVHLDGTAEKGSGLTAKQVDTLLEAVFGKSFAFAQDLDKASSREREAAWDLIAAELKQGEMVPVGLIWNETTSGDGKTITHSGHKVLVTGMTERDGEEYVLYTNPWGRTEEMPKDEFLGRLRNVNYTPR